MSGLINRAGLFDFGEAEDRQLDSVDAIEKAGSMVAGVERMKAFYDKEWDDTGGFLGAYKGPAQWASSKVFGSFSEKGTPGVQAQKASDPRLASLDSASEYVKTLTADNQKLKRVEIQSRINQALKGDYEGLTDDERWKKQSAKWTEQNPITAAIEGKEGVAGVEGSGLLGMLEKAPGGDKMKEMIQSGAVGEFMTKAKKFAGPAAAGYSILKSLADIKKADDKLSVAEHDAGVAATANQQNMKAASTNYHTLVKDSVSRVRDSGSDLAKTYGAQASKIISSVDNNKSNLDNELMDQTNEKMKTDLYSSLIKDKDTLMKQNNYQIEQGVGDLTREQTGLLQQLRSNQKLVGDIGDQRDQLKSLTNIAGTVAGGLV